MPVDNVEIVDNFINNTNPLMVQAEQLEQEV